MVARLWLVALAFLVCSLPARAAGKPPTKPEEVFGLTKIWSMHVTIALKDWERMQPSRGAFGRGGNKDKMPPLNDDRKLRGGFRYDFEYVNALLEIDGVKLPDVGIRFKGNSSYMLTANHLKRPFKIDLDRNDDEQTWGGMKKLTLNNNVMDTTNARENLAYGVYRAAGVPAPRTAYAEVRLTVPGKYDKVLVGLYTLIETVDKTFLKERFGSGKGLLMKPEGVGALDHLGEKWEAYDARYRPKSPATKQAQQRFIELTKLVNHGDDARFHKQIGSYLDVDCFLRYVAATVVLSSMDSFVGLGHNYYIYHDPKRDKFVILPWDLDHSFGSLTMFGSVDDLMNLSIRRPHPGRNRLVERLLADEKCYSDYTKHLAGLLKSAFTVEGVKRDLETITKALAEAKERERKALWARGDMWNGWLMLGVLGRPPELVTFTTKRVASVTAQLEGKSEGKVLRGGFGQPRVPGGADRLLAKPILDQADKDKDGKLSRAEIVEGAKTLFKACDKEGKGEIDQAILSTAMEKLMPKPVGGAPMPAQMLAVPLARAIFTRANKDNKVTAEQLVSAAEKLFEQCDKDKSGHLDQRELSEAIREVFTPPLPALGGKPK